MSEPGADALGAVIRMTGDGLTLGQFRLSRTGLSVLGQPEFDEWERCGAILRQIAGAMQWWVGDWLGYGESAYGEKYSQALAATDYEYQTLANWAWVARRIDSSRRRERLPYSIQAEVASLEPDEQSELLDAAEAAQVDAELGGALQPWTVRKMRDAVAAKRGGGITVEQGDRLCARCPYRGAQDNEKGGLLT